MEPLHAYRCTTCGHTTYPRHARCPRCRGRGFEVVELEAGRLINFTTVHTPPTGVVKPLHLGLVEFENGVRILGRLVVAPTSAGLAVRPVWAGLRERNGVVHSGYAFEPVPAP